MFNRPEQSGLFFFKINATVLQEVIMRASILAILLCLTISGFDNLDYGIPGKADYIVDRVGFAIGYSVANKQPRWTVYCLTREEVSKSNLPRLSTFYSESTIPTAKPENYRRSGYDMGHMIPAEDMSFSPDAMQDSFCMFNVCPQVPAMNRGIWKRLECWIRIVAVRYGEVWVITGPVLHKCERRIGNNAIPVPNAFFKVVYVPEPRKMIAFLIPNQESKSSIFTFAVTVDTVETLTGLDFFSMLPKPMQQELESKINISDWK